MLALLLAVLHLGAADSGRTISREASRTLVVE